MITIGLLIKKNNITWGYWKVLIVLIKEQLPMVKMGDIIQNLMFTIRNAFNETKRKDVELTLYEEPFIVSQPQTEPTIGNNSLKVETDGAGYTLLQRAVLLGDIEVVKSEILKYDAVRCVCCHPLHLACMTGHREIAVLLLKYGTASNESISCFCHTHSKENSEIHQKGTGSRYIKKGMALPQLLTALEVTILYDNDNILKAFGDMKLLSDQLLYNCFVTAARYGSTRCIEYMLRECEMSENITKEDSEGVSPLEYGIQWGFPFTCLLAGRCKNLFNFRSHKRETLLHLACRGVDSAEDAFYVINFLLTDTGLKQCVNELDIDGSSPLHVLLNSKTIRNKSLDEGAKGNGRRGSNIPEKSVHCCVCKDEGKSNKLKCLSMKSERDFKSLALKALLEKGGDADCLSPEGCHPVYIVVQCATSYQQMLLMLQVILKHAKHPKAYGDSCDCHKYSHAFGLVHLILQGFANACGQDPNSFISDCNLISHLCEILKLLTEQGFRIDPSHHVPIWSQLLAALDRITDPWVATSGHWAPEVTSETGVDVDLKYSFCYLNVLRALLGIGLDLNVLVEYSCWDVQPFVAIFISLVVRNKMAVGVTNVVELLRTLLQYGVSGTHIALPMDTLPDKFRHCSPNQGSSEDDTSFPPTSPLLHTMIACHELTIQDDKSNYTNLNTTTIAAPMLELLDLMYSICDFKESQSSIEYFLTCISLRAPERLQKTYCCGQEQCHLHCVFWRQIHSWQREPPTLYWMTKKRLRHFLCGQMSSLASIHLPEAIKEDIRTFT